MLIRALLCFTYLLPKLNTVAQILFFHHSGALDRLCKGGPAAAALVLIRGGKERLAGDDIHIDALFKLVPELACEGALRAALLRDAVLLHRQLVPDGLRRGQCSGAQPALLNFRSAHIGGKSLVDELLQRLRLLLFRDGTYDGLTHDIAAAVDHIGGGIGKDVGSKLSRLTI